MICAQRCTTAGKPSCYGFISSQMRGFIRRQESARSIQGCRSQIKKSKRRCRAWHLSLQVKAHRDEAMTQHIQENLGCHHQNIMLLPLVQPPSLVPAVHIHFAIVLPNPQIQVGLQDSRLLQSSSSILASCEQSLTSLYSASCAEMLQPKHACTDQKLE